MVKDSIKENRKSRDITQMQLSDWTGIPQTTLSAWEKGTNIPNVVDCMKLADFYGITVDELVGHELKKLP